MGGSGGAGCGEAAARVRQPAGSMPRPSTHPQALKLDEDEGREEAVLGALHAALGYAVAGRRGYRSIQCVVLCVFTLHCCRGRGSADQKQQRQGWHAQLSDALPGGRQGQVGGRGVGGPPPRVGTHTGAACWWWWWWADAAAGGAVRVCVVQHQAGSGVLLPSGCTLTLPGPGRRTGLVSSGTSGGSTPRWRCGQRRCATTGPSSCTR